MTETKWPESTTPHISLTNPLYKIYTANCDAETAIQREANKNNLCVPPLLSIKTLQSCPKINNELDPKCTLTTIRHNCNGVTTDDWTKFLDDLIKKMEELQLHSPSSKTKTILTNIGIHGKTYCTQSSTNISLTRIQPHGLFL
ncbi:27809_t:CDS:2 [Gigaspora margarita]|uniref:27809_t:CDS:1 n=1 Tax=Gigaspora margarita TaxID=4874 RepID=A0ABN7V1Q1_GIGMA|nr:27809_t:CDS:2 [Gigaspora margarita]